VAKVTLDNIIKLGMVKGHQTTEYEAYEEVTDAGEVIGPLYKSGEDSENLLSKTFPLIKPNGEYFPPEEPFVVRIRLRGDDKLTEWFYAMDCKRDCDFDYTLPVVFCKD